MHLRRLVPRCSELIIFKLNQKTMKTVRKLVLMCLVASFIAGCASSGLNVASDRRTDVDFSDYKTFNWVSDVGEMPQNHIIVGPRGVLIFNNRSTRSVIMDAIETQLKAKGFSRDESNPDMLVNFTVLEQDDQLRTYTRGGYSYLGHGPVDREAKMVDVEAGTVLVNFIDADSGLAVWQGFAPGALEESDVEKESVLQTKVAAIFNDFDFSAFSLN